MTFNHSSWKTDADGHYVIRYKDHNITAQGSDTSSIHSLLLRGWITRVSISLHFCGCGFSPLNILDWGSLRTVLLSAILVILFILASKSLFPVLMVKKAKSTKYEYGKAHIPVLWAVAQASHRHALLFPRIPLSLYQSAPCAYNSTCGRGDKVSSCNVRYFILQSLDLSSFSVIFFSEDYIIWQNFVK